MEFFPTSTPAISADEYNALQLENATLQERVTHLVSQGDSLRMELNEYRIKITNVGGVIADYYSENGEVTDELTEIANLLNIPLTKSIGGTATFEISWTAQVPLEFDPEDFEISFDVTCDTYEADDFEWNEENTEVNAEDWS